MSILETVRKKYGIATCSTDKTDRSPFVSNVSPQQGETEKFLDGLEPHEREAGEALLETIRMRERGEAPPYYTSMTTCKRCGPVPIWPGCPEEVLGCPWCLNRRKGLPIPNAG